MPEGEERLGAMAMVPCGSGCSGSLALKSSSELSSMSSSFSSSLHVSEFLVPRTAREKSQWRVYSPAFELRTPQALGSSPGFEENEGVGGARRAAVFGLENQIGQKLDRTHALGSLPDLDMFNDPR